LKILLIDLLLFNFQLLKILLIDLLLMNLQLLKFLLITLLLLNFQLLKLLLVNLLLLEFLITLLLLLNFQLLKFLLIDLLLRTGQNGFSTYLWQRLPARDRQVRRERTGLPEYRLPCLDVLVLYQVRWATDGGSGGASVCAAFAPGDKGGIVNGDLKVCV